MASRPPSLADTRATTSRTSSSSSMTSTRTRERLRALEQELEGMHVRREDTTRTPGRLQNARDSIEQARRGILGLLSPSASATSTPATTTRTRERLREVEEMLERARRESPTLVVPPTSTATRERLRDAEALISRLRRQGDTAALSLTDASRRLRELRLDESVATTSMPPVATNGLLGAVCSTDLLFLMDTTGSMASYIEAAKNQVRSIVKDLEATFYHEANIRIAVVGYKDHMDSPNIQFLDFTTSVAAVHSFLDGLRATGGNDEPEDVLGGLRQALNASWTQQTRCIIHIADAPPHGRALHDLGDSSDSYPTPGSEPHGLTHQPLFSRLPSLNINYALLRINNSTDLMAYTILLAYKAASADGTLLPSNKYSSRVGTGLFGAQAQGSLIFQEAELGTTFAALRRLVVKAVTASASRTAVRHVTRMARTSMGGPSQGLLLAPITEDGGGGGPEVRLDTTPPRWDSVSWFNETMIVEGFGLDSYKHGGAATLDDMMASDDNIGISALNLTIRKRKVPFAKGALRLAFHARTSSSTNRYVVKTFQRPGERLPVFAEGMRCHALCKAFALEFNSLVGGAHTIDFAAAACFKRKSSSSSSPPLAATGGDTCISLEPFLAGTYVKYNGNAGHVGDGPEDDPIHQAAQAFSHFTFERSRGRFLVCDLQGVGAVMTDPVVHTADVHRFKLSRTNLGLEGMKLFFSSHECNHLCGRVLGLKSNRGTMLATTTGTCTFRDTWPTMADAAVVCCCSNKLCARILPRAAALASPDFPGYHWCDGCLPQLQAFVVKWVCVEPGVQHQFEVSRFFYESQGLITPRKCAAHRGESAVTGRR